MDTHYTMIYHTDPDDIPIETNLIVGIIRYTNTPFDNHPYFLVPHDEKFLNYGLGK